MKGLLVLFLVTIASCQNDLSIFQDFNKWSELVNKSLNSDIISDSCSQQFTELFLNDFGNLLNFFDATSKWPWSGLSTGSYYDWGNYDQCIGIEHHYEKGKILGKYCTRGLLLPSSKVIGNPNPQVTDFYQLALCVPDACTAADFNGLFQSINLTFIIFQDQACHTKEDLTGYSWGDWTMTAVLGIIACLMVISTVYDVHLKRNKLKAKNPILLAFSVYTNGRKIIQTSKNSKEQIQVFNGIKTISMAWIIAGHGINGWNNFSVTDAEDVESKPKQTSTFYLTGSKLAVDTFFYMGGFLLGFIYIKQKSKPLVKHIKDIPLMIVHRYLRLTPAVAMLFFGFMTIYSHLGSGPLWVAGMKIITEPCRKHWLPFFFYAQNYANPDDLCIIPTWYLAADMQLYLISIFIIIPLTVLLNGDKSRFKRVMQICFVINVIFILLPIVTKLVWPDYVNEYDTHSRVINYTIGITMGIFIRERRDKPFLYGKFSMPGIVNLLIWFLVLTTMGILLVYYEIIVFSTKYSDKDINIYDGICRPLWCIGLSWIVYSSYYGYGGIVNWILARPSLQITAKLSYCMYLVHSLVVTHSTLITRERLYFSDWVVFNNWCGYFIISFIVAFIWSLAFESPMMIIEKQIFGGAAKTQRKSQNNNEVQTKEQYVSKLEAQP